MIVKPTTTKTVQDAYRIVLNDMLNSDCGLLVGKYDAKHGKPDFMYGIQTVMEWIAYKVSETDGDYFSDMFGRNIIESKKVIDK